MSQPAVSEPSAQIQSLLDAVAVRRAASQGLQATTQRQSEFSDTVFTSALEATLTGIAVDPQGRQVADQTLDTTWSDRDRQDELLSSSGADREVIIGSGFHAAVYAATRVLSGHPRPLVLERGPRAGGTFAMTTRPTFWLNSRNRAGAAGLAGDQKAALNYLPGAPIQAANLSMADYQPNTDMALVIRLALAQFADVVTNAEVLSVLDDGTGGLDIDINDRDSLPAGRVIDARGVGDPTGQQLANGTTILTFPQMMQRMASIWPLRGVRRVAVIGGGDSAKCAVESLLGIAPPPLIAAASLDTVERIDWYSDRLPSTCTGWQDKIRGRYQPIGRYLQPGRLLTVIPRRAQPIALPATALIEGRSYDLAVVCTGNQETPIAGLGINEFDEYELADGSVVASQHFRAPAFRVGPHARLPFTARERQDGIAAIPENAVSMFRTATKTAALAATLPAITRR